MRKNIFHIEKIFRKEGLPIDGLTLLLCLASFSCLGQTKGTVPSGFEHRLDTEHYVFLWNQPQTSVAEVEVTKLYAHQSFAKLEALVGKDCMPKRKLIVTFEGDGIDPISYEKKLSHVDYQARIHLFRYNPLGYNGPFLHELIHAVRKHTLSRWDRFFEEGFASAIGYYLEPETEEFSRFGYPMEVLAGYWYDTGKAIPMQQMQQEHDALLSCRLQSYVLREDFFTYLIQRGGINKYLEYAYAADVGSVGLYQSVWSSSFDDLVKDWEIDLKRRYKNTEGAQAAALEYLTQTPAKYIKVCQPGVDY